MSFRQSMCVLLCLTVFTTSCASSRHAVTQPPIPIEANDSEPPVTDNKTHRPDGIEEAGPMLFAVALAPVVAASAIVVVPYMMVHTLIDENENPWR